jgi:hypothetical protein
MSRGQKWLMVAAASGLLGVFDGRASADNPHLLRQGTPGSACVPADGKLTGEWAYNPFWGIAHVCGPSGHPGACTGSSTVVCPVNLTNLFTQFNDGTFSTAGTFDSLYVGVYDRSAASDVSCTLFVISDVGGGTIFSQMETSTGIDRETQVNLSFDHIGYPNFFPQPFGFFTAASLSCSVPPNTTNRQEGPNGISWVSNIGVQSTSGSPF